MPELMVFHKDRRIFHLALESSYFTVGRSSQNDLILTGDQVSRLHVVLHKREEGFWLEDKSTVGTVVNKIKVDGHVRLGETAVIEIADWRLVYNQSSDQQKNEDITRQTQITQLIEDNRSEDTGVLEFVPNTSHYRTLRPMILVDEPNLGRRQIKPKKKEICVGSASDCDVVLQDDFVSKKHVKFQILDRGLRLVDLDSKNGTFLDGAKIKECFLTEDKEITLGRTKILIAFEENKKQEVTPFLGNHFCGMIANSHVMKLLFGKIRLVAQGEMTVFIQGETGTGKELVAQAIHDLSVRRQKPYVVLNCGAVSTNLVESELFGHERGAFTGADQRHIGVFEQADGGTLFLDEIGELPLEAQAKILRVLEYQKIRRLGATQEIPVNVRLITATHRDLLGMVLRDQFREDLFYRLYVLPLRVSPLRERLEDIPLLAQHFMERSCDRVMNFHPDALKKLQRHEWPGNVRELKNTILRAVAFSEGPELSEDDIDVVYLDQPCHLNLQKMNDDLFTKEAKENILSPDVKEDFERQRVVRALESAGGDKAKAAQLLGLGRSTLFRKIKELGM